jgi:4-amino-4-deoxy-L-arabinose transferase-like glycosyltransferase
MSIISRLKRIRKPAVVLSKTKLWAIGRYIMLYEGEKENKEWIKKWKEEHKEYFKTSPRLVFQRIGG